MPKKSRRHRPKPGADLSIPQLKAIAKYLGYQLVQTAPPLIRFSLYDCRSGSVRRDDSALDHLRALYVNLDLADIPATEGGI